ncbi:MAG: exosortase/archaeosortase family protein [Methylococcales bacterium]|jgi:exosortase|nr:MAG: exosortase/archaeosortase family protein [Methylococcales bacterium]
MNNLSVGNKSIKKDSCYETQNKWLLAIVIILLLLLFMPTLLWLWGRWTMSVWQNGHGVLVFALVIYLIWRELQKLIYLPSSSNSWGFVILIPSLLIYMLDTGINTQLLSSIAMFTSVIGLSMLFLGTEKTKAILFPLLTMLLTLPIPLVFTEAIHLMLRHIATKSVAFILSQMGIPVFTSGTLLEIEGGTLMVADACSGFATLYAAITIAILTAYFCTSTKRRIVLLLIAAPLAIGVNIIRVLVLALLVNYYGLNILATSAHELSGLLTFMVALPILFIIGKNPINHKNFIEKKL